LSRRASAGDNSNTVIRGSLMRRRWIWALAGIALAATGGAAWRVLEDPAGAVPRTQAAPPPAIPVTIGVSERKDVPVYLAGLGTVQAYNTVTVHVRVDGELMRVHFTEGQDVKAGDLLAEIDPAPFQAALDQAIGKKGTDEAQLANARHDLERFAALLPRPSARWPARSPPTAGCNCSRSSSTAPRSP